MLAPRQVRDLFNILLFSGILWVSVHVILMFTNQVLTRNHEHNYNKLSIQSKLYADVRETIAKNYHKFHPSENEAESVGTFTRIKIKDTKSLDKVNKDKVDAAERNSSAELAALKQLWKYTVDKYMSVFRYHNVSTSQSQFTLLETNVTNFTHVQKQSKTEEKKTVEFGRRYAKPAESQPGCPVNYTCSTETEYNVRYNVCQVATAFSQLKLQFPDVSAGGSWSSDDCNSTDKIALIIPYRDREEHLQQFIANIIPFLQAQRKAFRIFVVEQTGEALFNKAQMMNAGFLESQKLDNFSCFIFHDVDMIPLNLCNVYTCHSSAVRHLGISKTPNNPHMVYGACIGGASAFTTAQFTKINGFSNLFFGWGGEDDDGFWRLRKEKVRIVRYPPLVGSYKPLRHRKYGKNFPRVDRGLSIVKHSNYRRHDGLTTVDYKVRRLTKELLFTRILVSVQGPTNFKGIKKDYVTKINEIRVKLNLPVFNITTLKVKT